MSSTNNVTSNANPENNKNIIAIIGVVLVFIAAIYGTDSLQKSSTKERFLKATEQMGSQDATARDAAIVTIASIFKDSPENQWSSLTILSNLIRTKSPTSEEKNKLLKNRKEAPEEVKTALIIIKNRDPKNDNIGRGQKEEERIINLTKSNLFGTDLQNAQLPNADLSGSDLTNVFLSGAHLEGAFLRKTYLRGSGLSNAHLNGANLREADLGGADLSQAILTDANLKGANLSNADLTGATITNEQIKQTCNWESAKGINNQEELKEETTEHSKTRSECQKFNYQPLQKNRIKKSSIKNRFKPRSSNR
jgi:Pentapeptide repeats (8 copies)